MWAASQSRDCTLPVALLFSAKDPQKIFRNYFPVFFRTDTPPPPDVERKPTPTDCHPSPLFVLCLGVGVGGGGRRRRRRRSDDDSITVISILKNPDPRTLFSSNFYLCGDWSTFAQSIELIEEEFTFAGFEVTAQAICLCPSELCPAIRRTHTPSWSKVFSKVGFVQVPRQ